MPSGEEVRSRQRLHEPTLARFVAGWMDYPAVGLSHAQGMGPSAGGDPRSQTQIEGGE